MSIEEFMKWDKQRWDDALEADTSEENNERDVFIVESTNDGTVVEDLFGFSSEYEDEEFERIARQPKPKFADFKNVFEPNFEYEPGKKAVSYLNRVITELETR